MVRTAGKEVTTFEFPDLRFKAQQRHITTESSSVGSFVQSSALRTVDLTITIKSFQSWMSSFCVGIRPVSVRFFWGSDIYLLR